MMHGYGKQALIEIARRHWRQQLPARFRSLRASGQLENELAAAAELTIAEMDDLKEAGFSPHEAWEATREHHLLLREESSQEEPSPPNPAYDALVEKTRAMRDIED